MLNIGADGAGTLYLQSYKDMDDDTRCTSSDDFCVDDDDFVCRDADGNELYWAKSYRDIYRYLSSDTSGKIKCYYTNDSGREITKAILDEATFHLNCFSKGTANKSTSFEKFRNENGTKSYCWGTKDSVPGETSRTRYSDKRLKNILSDFNKGMSDLENLETYNFTYKSDTKQRNHVGLIAQKLKGVYDEALHQDEKGYLSYEKEPIMYSMVNAVKEIFKSQKNFDKKQAKLNKKADKLIRMYE